MIAYKITNIIWDTEGEHVSVLNLPREIDSVMVDDPEEIADAISDHYGWCVLSFDSEEIIVD